MATSHIKDWLAGAGAAVSWIEFEAYAHRVFANASPDWYRDPTRFAAAMIQAQGVIATQCLSLDVLAPFVDDPSVTLSGRQAVLEQLSASAPTIFVQQSTSALFHRFDQRLDLVLKLRSPRDLLGQGDGDVSFDDLDDVATALIGFMRTFADKPLAGVMLEHAVGTALSADDVDACEPIVAAARHYGWFTALSLPLAQVDAASASPLDVDLLLLPSCGIAELDALSADVKLGGGLNDDFWMGAAALSPAPRARLLYGRVPAGAAPEKVIEQVRALAAC